MGGYPEKCNLCVKDKINEFEINLSVKPYWESQNPWIMLVGLNPTLVKKQARVVLELDDNISSIYEYIVNDVLKPSGIDLLKDVYATNLIKCTFPKEPRRICRDKFGKAATETVKNFLQPYFMNCKQYLTKELREISPKIVISFGEVPHQLLWEEFDWSHNNVERDMSKAFGNTYNVNISGLDIAYMPCIRPVARAREKLRQKFPTFIKELKKLAVL